VFKPACAYAQTAFWQLKPAGEFRCDLQLFSFQTTKAKSAAWVPRQRT